MRISVNLATRPFVELRPFFLRLRIFMAALVLVGAAALVASHVLQKKLDVASGRLNAVHAKVVQAQQEKQGNERRMREPANAAVLARAHFLNALFLRKSFSWTAVMMDLETVLPAGVQVTSIEPDISSDGDVVIRMRVSGDRDKAVQLVRNLERSKRFLAPRLTGEAQEAKETGGNNNAASANNLAPPGVEFEILADYNPLPEGQLYAGEKTKEAKGSTAAKQRHEGAASRKSKRKGTTRPAAGTGRGAVPQLHGTAHPRQQPQPGNGGGH